MTIETSQEARELADLFTLGSGNLASSMALVVDIMDGKLTLPPCFNVKGGTPEQTKRAHDLALILAPKAVA
jgi:hypothetical protein